MSEIILQAAVGIVLTAVVLVGIAYYVLLFVVLPWKEWRR